MDGDKSTPTGRELNTVMARLELRKQFLGGLFGNREAERYGEQSQFEEERIRSRNWELLRQCAEKTGLYFESLSLSTGKNQYGILWFPEHVAPPAQGTSIKPIWKLLNIKDPWTDNRLKAWTGLVATRQIDSDDALLPEGDNGGRTVKMVPIALYSLSYPRFPLLLVNFRDKLQVRRREVTQRAVNEITGGVIGISHFTNWYYYAGAMLYDVIWSRHGIAVDQALRLDSYSQFRAELAFDNDLDPRLRSEIARYAESVTVNPFGVAAEHKAKLASEHFARLEAASADDGKLLKRLDNERRAELGSFGESTSAGIVRETLHMVTFGRYTHRVSESKLALSALDRERRATYHLEFLDALVKEGTQPEVSHEPHQIEASVADLNVLMAEIDSAKIRQRATVTLDRLKSLSRDPKVQNECSVALIALRDNPSLLRAAAVPAIASSPRVTARPLPLAGSH